LKKEKEKMNYEKELRLLISNLFKKNRSSSDFHIWCPECQKTMMEFRGRDWHCLGRACGFEISEKELPGPGRIDNLIKEVESEKKITEIKNIIREILNLKK